MPPADRLIQSVSLPQDDESWSVQGRQSGIPGYDDVLLFNEKGEVTESTIANMAVEIEGKLCTPPVQCGLLPGHPESGAA